MIAAVIYNSRTLQALLFAACLFGGLYSTNMAIRILSNQWVTCAAVRAEEAV